MDNQVLNVDKLTYAGHLESLIYVEYNPRYSFKKTAICDAETVRHTFDDFQPDLVLHLAAESHVDRYLY